MINNRKFKIKMKSCHIDHDEKECKQSLEQLTGCEQTIDEIKFETSLFNACVYGDLERVKHLIKSKGSSIINDQDKNGYTGLHYAARNNHLETCKLLLKFGAKTNLTTNSCLSTPLHRAAYMGHFEIVKLLLDYKSNPFLKDCDGKTPLHKSVQHATDLNLKSFDKSNKFIKTITVLINFDLNLLQQIDNNNKTVTDYNLSLINFLKNENLI
jgi:ankyrin repeat protein